MSDDIELFQAKTSASREHVGEIEQGIIVVKEQARSVIAFKSLHKQIVIHLIYFVFVV